MAASSMKDIKNRIKSVEGTMHITKAMELVASSKLRRAKERAQAILPFMKLLEDTMAGVVASCGDGVLTSFNSKKKHEGKENVLIVLIAGDRGLAGGFNNNVFKLAEETKAQNSTSFLPIGKKAYEYCTKRGYTVICENSLRADETNEEECTKLCEELTAMYKNGDIDTIYVVYNEFVSMLSQEPRAIKLLPFDKSHIGTASRALTLYEPSPEAVINAVIPQYIGGMLYGSVCESLASEYGARRMAMESASKNALELIDDLSLKYNRARQASITNEITEIVSGANAL